MSDVFEALDPHDPRLALRATGLLATFNRTGVITAGDVHVARALGELGHEPDESVLLAVALTCRAVRTGSVCLDLSAAADEFALLDVEAEPDDSSAVSGGASLADLRDLPWPDADAWRASVASSPLVEVSVLRWEEPRLYLDRYHEQETQVLDDLLQRASSVPAHDLGLVEAALSRVFRVGDDGTDTFAEQRAAVRAAAQQWTTVLTGGPGTGKTTTVAGLLVALHEQESARGHSPRIALAAPTGKAAARLQEAVREAALGFDDPADRARVEGLSTSTLHRLLRPHPGNSTRFRHDRHNRLPYDLVVVDEASMVSLTMTARLLEAMRPDARLVLVGDPDQLSSVDAGAVLGDLVKGFEGSPLSPVAALSTTHRFSGGIAALARALRSGDADAVVEALRHPTPLADGSVDVEWVTDDDPSEALRGVTLRTATEVRARALSGDHEGALHALAGHRLLCAHREGPFGVHTWNRRIEQWLNTATATPVHEQFYVGRPVLVTANDYGLGVYNGDSGVVVSRETGPRVFIDTPGGARDFAPSRMNAVETVHAMTIHKAQGSQADEVTVLLPSEDSRLLTRELLYTAVTRARRTVRVVASESMVRAAVERTARRASGLAERLRDHAGPPAR